MAFKAYLVIVDLKSYPGTDAQVSKSYLVVPPQNSTLSELALRNKAFEVVADAVHKTSKHPVIEETSTRNVLIADLAPLRSPLVIDSEDWKCFDVTA